MKNIFWFIFLPIAVLCLIGSWNSEHPVFSIIQAVFSMFVWYLLLKIVFWAIRKLRNKQNNL